MPSAMAERAASTALAQRLLQEQVFERVARHRQFGEDREAGGLPVAGAGGGEQDGCGVAGRLRDGGLGHVQAATRRKPWV